MPRERKRTISDVAVVANGETVVVHGRAALLIGLIAADAAHINALPVGQVVAHVARGELKLEIHEVRSVLRYEEPD